MIRALRVTTALLLLAAAVGGFVLARATADRLLALAFGLLALLWSVMPLFERGDRRQGSRSGAGRAVNAAALALASTIIAIVAVRHGSPLAALGVILAELAVLFAWLASALPAVPGTPCKEGKLSGGERRAGESYLRRRAARLALVFAAAGGSALAAFGLSHFLRVPYLLVSLLGIAWCILIVLLIRRLSVRPIPPEA